MFRYVYNWALGEEIKSYNEGNGFIGLIDLQKKFGKYRNQTEWLKEIPLNTGREAIRNLINAYDHYFKGHNGFPKFKSKKVVRKSFQVRNEQFAFRFYEDSVRISGLPVHETVKCGHHNMPTDKDAKFHKPTIIFDGYNYWLSVSVEIDTDNEQIELNDYSLGIDIGLRTSLQLSSGESYNLPDNSKLEKRKRRQQSRLDKMRMKRLEESKRTKTKFDDIPMTKNEQKLRYEFYKTNQRMFNRTNSATHLYTKRIVEKLPKRIVVEDLDVEKMIQGSYIGRFIKPSGFARMLHQLEYKSKERGIEFVKADRFFPSSQICSSCGNRHKQGPSKIYKCPVCGLVIDRDLNAAINLSQYG